MSAHYSKYRLNTYGATPYFQSQLPKGYRVDDVLMKSRAFRRLPPRLRELSALAKRWAIRRYPDIPGGMFDVEKWYDEDGNELDPTDGHILTDEEVDAEWDALPWADKLNARLKGFEVDDVPEPDGGFADPDTWEEPPPEPDDDTDDPGITEEQLLKDIKSHGREYVAKESGIPADTLFRVKTDEQLAEMILNGGGRT